LTSAAAGNSSVGLTWTAPGSNGGASITAYKVYRSTTSGGETLLTTVGNVNSFTDTTAVNGNTYFYDVSAVNSVGEGAASNERAATPATVPGAPTLTAAVAGGSSVALAWNAPASNGGAQITGYDVYRGTTSGGETLLTTLGSMSTYIDASLSAGTTYYYTVSAVNSRGEGARSNELSATPDATPPAKPAGVKLVVAGTNQLALDWEASTDNVGVSRYNVFRNNVLVGTVTETQYLDSGLTAGASYTYQVRAVDAAGNFSQPSSNLTAKTFAVSNVATGTLAGAVYDATGKRLANAIVTLVVSGGTKTAKTNASGAWKISNLPPATYAPIVSLKGYRSHTLSMSAEAGKTVLAAATLTV
jgi:fibronectin type 3 domain-containing protein